MKISNLKLPAYTRFYALIFGLSALVSCQQQEETTAIVPEVLQADTVFKESKDKSFDLKILEKPGMAGQSSTAADSAVFTIQLNDKPLGIRLEAADGAEGQVLTEFAMATFINAQHTAMLVQVKDQSGLTAPFYIVSLKSAEVKAYRLYRASLGEGSSRFAKGQSAIGRSLYLINNDFVLTRVDGRVYLLKRQNPEERIAGVHVMNSKDKKTLVFLVNSTLYQVNYQTGKNRTFILPANTVLKPVALFAWIQQNLTWEKDQDGDYFLQPAASDNRIRSLNEFD